MTKIFLGKPVSDHMTAKLYQELKNSDTKPKIKTIRIGSREDDVMYESMIAKKMLSLEIDIETLVFEENDTDMDIYNAINKMNNDEDVDGIMLFRPLPKHFDEEALIRNINPKKDVDSANPITKVITQKYPCTAQAVIDMLEFYDVEMSGKNAVILGRSEVVGKPLVDLLLEKNATVTICHSKTKDIKKFTREADILISAMGSAKAIDRSFVNENTVVIDVGINTDSNGNLCGDVDYDDLIDECQAISPVPRGIGSITTSILARNLIELSKHRKDKGK